MAARTLKFRRPTGAIAVVVGLVLLGLALFSGPARGTTSSVTDPTGDTADFNGTHAAVAEPHGDITAASMSDDGTTISATLNVSSPEDPATSNNWKNGQPTGIAWTLDTNSDGTDDFVLAMLGTSSGATGSVIKSSDHSAVACDVAVSYDGTYHASAPASCVESPSQFKWASAMTYDQRPTNSNGKLVFDRAPNSGPAPTPVTADTLSTSSSSSSSSTSSSSSSTSSTSSSTTTTVFIPGASNTTPSGSLSSTTVPAGGAVGISSSGWFPNGSITITLHSDPVALGTFSADSSGRLAVTVTIPANTAAGAHTVDLTGVGADSNAHTVSLGLTVIAPAPLPPATVLGSTATKGLSVTGRSVKTEVAIGIWLVIVGLALVGVNRPRRSVFGSPLR